MCYKFQLSVEVELLLSHTGFNMYTEAKNKDKSLNNNKIRIKGD